MPAQRQPKRDAEVCGELLTTYQPDSMANTLGVYNPTFYAQEALIQLEKSLGLASRVYMGFDDERRGFGRGDTISIRRPSSFTAAAAPASASNVTTETVSITLGEWKEVKFSLTDKELAYSGERIINDHIRPAAVALADDIDQYIAQAMLVGAAYHTSTTASWATVGSTGAFADIPSVRKAMFDRKVPLHDRANMHMMLNGTLEAEVLGNAGFAQQQGAGDGGAATQMTGAIGPKFGFNLFANQNQFDWVNPNVTDVAGALTAAAAVGDTTIGVDAFGTSDVLTKGTPFTVAGDTQGYVLTADTTMSSGAGTLSFFPAAKVAWSDNDVITIEDGTSDGATGNMGMAFHSNAYGFASAPLSEMGSELGAAIATVQDPITGLSLRSRVFYVGDSSKVVVALDVLYGGAVLDVELMQRIHDVA